MNARYPLFGCLLLMHCSVGIATDQGYDPRRSQRNSSTPASRPAPRPTYTPPPIYQPKPYTPPVYTPPAYSRPSYPAPTYQQKPVYQAPKPTYSAPTYSPPSYTPKPTSTPPGYTQPSYQSKPTYSAPTYPSAPGNSGSLMGHCPPTGCGFSGSPTSTTPAYSPPPAPEPPGLSAYGSRKSGGCYGDFETGETQYCPDSSPSSNDSYESQMEQSRDRLEAQRQTTQQRNQQFDSDQQRRNAEFNETTRKTFDGISDFARQNQTRNATGSGAGYGSGTGKYADPGRPTPGDDTPSGASGPAGLRAYSTSGDDSLSKRQGLSAYAADSEAADALVCGVDDRFGDCLPRPKPDFSKDRNALQQHHATEGAGKGGLEAFVKQNKKPEKELTDEQRLEAIDNVARRAQEANCRDYGGFYCDQLKESDRERELASKRTLPRVVQVRQVPGEEMICRAAILNEQTGAWEGGRTCQQSCSLTVYDNGTSERSCGNCCN